jgi:hypothetical protein
MQKKIRTITVNQFDYLVRNVNDERPEIHEQLNHFQEFDLDGHPLKDARYNRSGDLEEMYEYTYSESGLLLSETYYQEESEAAEKRTFEHNSSGKPERILKHYLDGSVDTTTLNYDAEGQLIVTIRKDDEGETEQVERFHWADGRLIMEEIFDGGENPVSRRSMKYDEKGNITELLAWNAEDDAEIRTVSEFDDAGELISVKRFDNDGDLLDAHIFQTDEDGNKVSFTENSYGPRVQSQIVYNAKGKPVKEEEVTEEGDVLTRVERKYDEDDRELETEVFIDGRGQAISRHYFLKYEYTFFED